MTSQNTIAINEAWPSTLFLCDWGGHAEHATGLEACIREQADGFSEPIASQIALSAKSATGLVESPLQFFNSVDNQHLNALIGWIDNCVRAAVAKVNGGTVPPSQLEVNFNQSWFHITNDGGFHDAHTHGACSWCGIYYLDAGEAAEVPEDGANVAGNGVNRFYSPMGWGGMVRDYGNAYLGRGYLDVQPMAGRMVIFPSYLLHSALPYRGNKDRIIVSFNSVTRLKQ